MIGLKRLIQGGGVRINGKKINDSYYPINPQDGQVLQIGKNYYKKLKFLKD